jgi:hypothetical protein
LELGQDESPWAYTRGDPFQVHWGPRTSGYTSLHLGLPARVLLIGPGFSVAHNRWRQPGERICAGKVLQHQVPPVPRPHGA